MKTILILSLLAPNLLLGQGTPDTGNSKLWEMRKKVQQRSAQRTGSYVEQMNQALQSGDAGGAESALKAAIAQGTLAQTQINDARGRIDSMVSQQRQAMVAQARAKQEAEARAAEAERMAVADAEASSARRAETKPSSAAVSSGRSGQATPQESELDRFRSRFKGRSATFTVVNDDGGGMASSNDLVLRDADTGKKFRVGYTYGLGSSLGEGKSMEGRSVIIQFSGDGSPRSIKNPANGKSFGIDPEWKVTGYGW